MACGKYNCKTANNPCYQAGYMARTYFADQIQGANMPYNISSQTSYRLPAGSVGMAGSYN